MKPTRSVHLALLLVQLLFGLWPVAGARVLDEISPAALIGARTLAAVPIFLLMARGAYPPLSALPKLAGLALLGVSMNQLLYAEGLKRAGPINGVVLAVLIPILTLFFGVLLGRERPTAKRLTGILAATVGVLILTRIDRFDLGDERLVGTLLILANTTCYAAYLVLGKRTFESLGPLPSVAAIFALGALEALPYTAGPILETPWTALSPVAYASLLFILLGPTIGAYGLNAYALTRADSSLVASYVSLQPLFGVSAAWLWLGTPVEPRALLAGAAIVLGVWLSSRSETAPARRLAQGPT